MKKRNSRLSAYINMTDAIITREYEKKNKSIKVSYDDAGIDMMKKLVTAYTFTGSRLNVNPDYDKKVINFNVK